MDLALVISVLVLIAAPLLARLVNKHPSLKGGLDGFVLITVLGLITLTLLPEALNTGGLWGLVVAAFGFFLPWITERMFHKSEEMTHRVLMFIAALALVIHAASDGAILAFANNMEHGSFLATGVVLHRVGVAIAVWWLLRPILTTFGGIAVLLALGAVTMVGYFMVLFAGEWYSVPLVGYWQAFAAGSLFHIVMHPLEDHNTAPEPHTSGAHRIGTAFGIIFIISLISAHYFQHAPGPIVEAVHAHDSHHDVDMLAGVGRLIAPIMLLVMGGAGIYAHIQGQGFKKSYEAVQAVAPWTVLLWLCLGILAALFPEVLPMAEHGEILFAIWLIALSAIIVHTGARAFFSVLMPSFVMHKHSHSHSHH
ncbi:hypothetical protein KFE96_17995 [Kordiimonas sp. SCSIO 12603]|uniref:hypothetical protein n=1 Tax=Kordiimonas sp. SCSIO 12603 TaxID=2829596 RepID=UPI0021073FBC|nr:hypothetical protein [Kordiimonas sp. SCSIO 12603]UTW58684.1 hypothetical protein KFE96_17995 [Kordiimonas sp. SCSIO 12603]